MDKKRADAEYERLKKLRAKKEEDMGGLEFFEKITEYLLSMKEKYPNFVRTVSFHVFSYSGLLDEFGEMEEVDFPGDDALEVFVRNLK